MLQAVVAPPPSRSAPLGPARRAPRPTRALFEPGGQGSNGADPAHQDQQQQPSIQHPLFPEAEAERQAALGQWRVQTQRGLPLFQTIIPNRPCPVCGGTGKSTCGDCRGKGRLNYRWAAMLPQGVWPQWCPTCRASGRWCCASCMGTGVRRSPIGFRPHNDDEGDE